MREKPDYILNIETSTSVCSASISSGSTALVLRESAVDKSHAAMLTVFIEELMKELKIQINELAAVAVSRGPGSYTGLRIGVSTAKGICYASDLPLIAIDTLKTMVMRVISMPPDDLPDDKGVNRMHESALPSGINAGDINIHELIHGKVSDKVLLCPMLDARRMEVYSALFDAGVNRIRETRAEIIDELSFRELLEKNKILFFGDGAYKCSKIIRHVNAVFLKGFYPSAANMAELSHKAFAGNKFENTAYFEPFYLKDFVATTPKNKIM